MIDENELDVEDVVINDDDNGQEEYEDEKGLNKPRASKLRRYLYHGGRIQ